MKKIFIIISLLVLTLGANAQRGRLKTIAVDTLQGNENVTFSVIPVTGDYNTLFISAKVDRISTAAGGTLYLKEGLSSATALTINQTTNPNLSAAPNDTLATADVATQYVNWSIENPAGTNYYVFGDGDANDTIKVTISYFLK